tara:strand:+ start:1337 stop:1516 length:180 start_codon:yes stop_codon:yes gene_type:complete
MLKYLTEFWNKITDKENDPVRSCDVYKKIGCSHVDGYLCDMKTCDILKDYKKENNNAGI